MRLPDRSDRELVGRAANLDDDQITEIAKFPRGVVAIYQNEWVQPVLCKVYKHPDSNTLYSYTPVENEEHMDIDAKTVSKSLLDCIMNNEVFRKGNRADILRLKSMVVKSKLDTSVKRDFMEYIASDNEDAIESLRYLIYEFLTAEEAIKASIHCNEIGDWVRSVVEGLRPPIKDYSKKQIDLALALIIYEQSLRNASYNEILCRFTEIYKAEGGVY